MPKPYLITIAQPVTAELTEKKSRFISQAFPAATEKQAQEILAAVRTRHHDARHHVYAWIIGADNQFMRSNDDGEPAGTGGRPVLEAIKKSGLQNIILVVTRYFGGILLGSGGLTRAYGKAAQMALDNAAKVQLIPAEKYALTIGYPLLDKTEAFLCQHKVTVIDKIFTDQICLICAIDQKNLSWIREKLTNLCHGNLRLDSLGEQIQIKQSI